MADASHNADTDIVESAHPEGKKRDTFASRTGFILACVGSAVGMANIWLFPYRVAEFGGAAFLIPYFIFVLLLGFTGVIGEMAFGRAMGAGPMGAFGKALEMRGVKNGNKIGRALGLIPTLGTLGIAIGYAVVLGWALKYAVGSLSGELIALENVGAYFGAITSDFGNIPFHIGGLIIAFIVMVVGISKGIERLNKVLMPVFFVLLVIVAIRVVSLPGARAGYQYLLMPRWEALANPTTVMYALGQAFFSLSLAGAGTVVYGSYLKKDENVVTAARNVAIFDTFAACVAACAIVPAVFAFGLDISSGPPLMFITLPGIFQSMPAGNLFMIIFFVAVCFAAITSLVNLFEPPIEAIEDQFKIPRWAAVVIVAIPAVGIGLFLENGDIVSTWMDIVSIYIMPVGALMAAIMFFWVCPKGYAKSQAELGYGKELGPWFDIMTKYVFVPITAAVIILGIFYGGIG